MWNESSEVLCRKKHVLRHKNKVNENKVLSYCDALRCSWNNKKLFTVISNLQISHFKLDFQNSKHGSIYRRQVANPRHQTQRGQSKSGIPCKHDIKEPEGETFNPTFKENVQGRKTCRELWICRTKLLSYRKPKRVVQNERMSITFSALASFRAVIYPLKHHVSLSIQLLFVHISLYITTIII